MGNRSRQGNVADTLTADAGFGNLNAAAVTDHAFISDFLVLSAMALPVLGGSENPLAVQAVLLRLQCPVVDGFRFFNLAVGPFKNLFR